MENNNTEQVKKERKPRLPKLQRRFVNLQEELKDLQEEVSDTIQRMTKVERRIEPKTVDFSTNTTAELFEIQAKLSAAIARKIGE